MQMDLVKMWILLHQKENEGVRDVIAFGEGYLAGKTGSDVYTNGGKPHQLYIAAFSIQTIVHKT
ncbi:MAG: hypothetical protein H7257_10065 [Taibaiella sp.]|nr:hypothetical protein [Taibaiella sp.]